MVGFRNEITVSQSMSRMKTVNWKVKKVKDLQKIKEGADEANRVFRVFIVSLCLPEYKGNSKE
jgi:hypothetical protein